MTEKILPGGMGASSRLARARDKRLGLSVRLIGRLGFSWKTPTSKNLWVARVLVGLIERLGSSWKTPTSKNLWVARVLEERS